MNNHAPGPWKLGIQDGNFVDIDSECHGGLAQVVWLMEDDEVEGRSSPQCEANARLIAAAPDLLAALEDIVKHIHMDIGMQRRAQDAIDEARGVK